MKSYYDKKKFKRHFPMDFYGESEGWQFAVRALSPAQVLSAKRWVARLNCRRRDFRLVDLAIDCFHFVSGGDEQMRFTGVDLGTKVSIRRQGQIVTVDALNHRYGALIANVQSSISTACIEPASKVALS
ncbi:hypothetical protein BZG13_03285 [Salinivibrio sp. ML323]|uniref:hypothetical protein n=1 Tax=unclassified Salinivibrio TaxID=2636825 RepID=UPI0009864701|nr:MULTISPECIES: hypothetical protein [unclassified Salinivibrio]OOE59396.1 hypothetical protein BZG13_03285 [Salinivibrio sp. ML323]OOE62733.1 hypothetical protein BZG14_10740 [Salinivibrio sp. IB282]